MKWPWRRVFGDNPRPLPTTTFFIGGGIERMASFARWIQRSSALHIHKCQLLDICRRSNISVHPLRFFNSKINTTEAGSYSRGTALSAILGIPKSSTTADRFNGGGIECILLSSHVECRGRAFCMYIRAKSWISGRTQRSV